MIKLNLMEAAMKSAGTAKMARVEPEQPTVLIVEPSSERRRVARMALALAGYVCREAADTSAALLILRSCSPVAIVTGVPMAGPCDGIGLCEIVRARTDLRDCAVVVLSDRGDPDRLRRIAEAGASAMLPQPFSPIQLVAAVNAAVAAAAGRPHSPTCDIQRQPLPLLSLMTTLAITE